MIRTFTNSDIARFWKYVQKTESCWLWTGAKLKGNYGAFQLNRKCIGAHIFSFLIHFGNLTNDLLVRHTCDNPPCVRPNHLLSGTVLDNVTDRDTRKRTAVGERNGMSKLTESIVQAIRLDTRDFSSIAKEHGVIPAEIGHIKHLRIWRHAEGKIVFGNKRCKLTNREILTIYNDTRTQVEIARSFGIGTNAVWYIKHRVTHRQITNAQHADKTTC